MRSSVHLPRLEGILLPPRYMSTILFSGYQSQTNYQVDWESLDQDIILDLGLPSSTQISITGLKIIVIFDLIKNVRGIQLSNRYHLEKKKE